MKFAITLFLILCSSVFRTNAATFTVINTNDAGPGSLRDAINLANASPGADLIDFNIPGFGPQTINILSQLPPLIDLSGVAIDGLTQAGASAGINPPATLGLMININGFAAGPSHGFIIQSANNTIQGLAIELFEQDGIRIETTPTGSMNNLVLFNIIGSNTNGVTPLGNGSNMSQPWGGVHIVAAGCAGLAFANIVQDNMISANYAEGVSMSSCPPADVFDNHIIHNYIGTDISGTAPMGNIHDGVYMGEGTHDNVVDNNIICDNGYEGVCMIGYVDPPLTQWFTHTNTVNNNSIGVDANGSPMGNVRDGVSCGIYGPSWYLGHAPNNTIINNTIANNGRNGVVVFEHPFDAVNGDGNRIIQNSMSNNTLLGIDLDDDGISANDVGDPDNSANELINFPMISNISHCNGTVTINGTVDVPAPLATSIELFVASTDPSGNGEGNVYLISLTPDALGNWTTTLVGTTGGDNITATSTDAGQNTSEFSSNFMVPPNFTVSETHIDVSCAGGTDGSIDVTPNGGVTPYTYIWAHGPITEDVTGLTAGAYSVTAGDNVGCSLVLNVTITEPSTISISLAVTDASCNGCSDGEIDATVSGGTPNYTYSWDNSATTEDITGLAAGVYCLTVTDANGCTAVLCDTVFEPASVDDLSEEQLMVVYPNPANELITVELNSSELIGGHLILMDNQGREINEVEIEDFITEINVSMLESGMYFVLLENVDTRVLRKILINQ